jgi:hypothetical protein
LRGTRNAAFDARIDGNGERQEGSVARLSRDIDLSDSRWQIQGDSLREKPVDEEEVIAAAARSSARRGARQAGIAKRDGAVIPPARRSNSR